MYVNLDLLNNYIRKNPICRAEYRKERPADQ